MSKTKEEMDEISEGFDQVRNRIKELKGELIVINIAMIVLGVVMIAIPKPFTEFIGQILGGVLCIWGVLRCISFLRLKGDEMFGSFALVQGAAMIGFGIFFVTQPSRFSDLLNSALVLAVLIAAVFKLQNAINYMKLKLRFWWIHLLIAVLLIAFGVIAIIRPGWVDTKDGLAVLVTVIIGIAFVISGIWDLFSIIYLSKVIKKHTDELEAAGVIPTEVNGKKSRKDKKNVVKVKDKDVKTKSNKRLKEEESISFEDPELDDIDNIDYDDGYNDKKK